MFLRFTLLALKNVIKLQGLFLVHRSHLCPGLRTHASGSAYGLNQINAIRPHQLLGSRPTTPSNQSTPHLTPYVRPNRFLSR
jgi:hypothetical protein